MRGPAPAGFDELTTYLWDQTFEGVAALTVPSSTPHKVGSGPEAMDKIYADRLVQNAQGW
ncbi:hypothetical protein Ntsu_44220 [Nocardia sp. IFM 10818]